MKILLLLLLSWIRPAQSPGSRTTVVRNNKILGLIERELVPKRLFAVYGKSFHAEKTAIDEYHDTMLRVDTSADKLEVYKDKCQNILLNASITSRRLTFGHGIRIGATKAAFCQAFNLSPNYDVYRVLEAQDGSLNIDFTFKQGILTKVTYRVNYFE